MTKIDNGLVGALLAGAGELPTELGALGDCLDTIARLLAEKASELEPSWSDALVAAAEVETLLALEAAVTARAVTVRAGNLDDVRAKLGIWRVLAAAADPETLSPRDGLVLSIADDLDALRLH